MAQRGQRHRKKTYPEEKMRRIDSCLYRRGQTVYLWAGRMVPLGRGLSLSQARRIRDLRRGAAASSRAGVAPDFSPMPVEVLLDRYLADIQAKIAASSYRRLREHRAHLLRHLGDFDAQRITREDITDYLTARKAEAVRCHGKAQEKHVSNATINRELTLLSAAYELAVDDDRCPKNPVRRSAFLPVPRLGAAARPPSLPELRAILAEARKPRWRTAAEWLPALVMVSVGTAERLSAVCGLRVADVDFESGVIKFPDDFRKGGVHYSEPRYAPMPPFLSRVLSERIVTRKLAGRDFVFQAPRKAGHPIPRRTVWAAWVKVCGAAEISPVPRVHDLRHLTITVLGKAGLGEQLTASFAGYHSTQMVKVYTHFDREADATRPAADLIEERLNGYFTEPEKGDGDGEPQSTN